MLKNKGLTIFSCLVFAFLFLPLLLMAITAFGEASTITFPIEGFTLKWFGNVFASNAFMEALKLSTVLALLATLLGLIIGIPAAYALARYTMKGKAFLKGFFLSPTIVPGIVVGYAIYQFVVVSLRMPIFESLLLGHFLVVLPYSIRIVSSSLEQFDFSIEEVAWTLGCNKWKTFFKIVIPNITSGISAAFMLSFINSFNNIPVSMFLSGPGVSTLPTALMNHIEYNYDPTVSAISVLLMLATIAIMFVVEKTLGIAAFTK